jgi:capsular polysaccharide biosynthesis protein
MLLNTAVAILLGGALALGIALVRELFDRRVRNAEDIVQVLDLPVIGLLPRQAALGFWRRSKGSLMQQRVLGQRRIA